MDWEEYKKTMPEYREYSCKKKVNVKCPKCGELIYKRTDIILTSYPAQYQYECDCGWRGTAYV